MSVTKRAVTFDDLETINELAKAVKFDIGLENLKLYFETSPQTWHVAVNENNEIVGYDSYNRLNIAENVCFGFQLVIKNDYAGKGLVHILEGQHYAPFGIIGNATHESVIRFPYDKFGDKILGYRGTVRHEDLELVRSKDEEISVVQVIKFSETHLEDLLSYDFSILGINRKQFMKEWVSAKKHPCDTVTLCAYKNGCFCGYGTLRECSNYFQICPLYADDDIIAEKLLHELTKHLPKGKELLIWFLAKNRLVTKWVINLKFRCTDSETRVFMKPYLKADLWNMKKVYGLHDYYPV